MLDHLRALAVFAKVADAGSFRGAARQLGLSASVVSHHVTSLERHLDTPLIYRTTRKLSLTAAGRQLAQSARAMLGAAQAGFNEIGHSSANPTGSLSVTAPALLQYARFLKRTSTFMKRHPNVEISITFSDKRHNIVEEGFDLAFRIGWLDDSSLKARKLADGRQVLVASPDYISSRRGLRNPDDLARLELIKLAGLPTTVQLVPDGAKSAGRKVRIPHRIMVDSGFAAMRMAKEGCGITVLPDFLVRDEIDDGALVEVLPQWSAPTFGIYAVWPGNAGTNLLRSAYVDYVAQIARSEPDRDE